MTIIAPGYNVEGSPAAGFVKNDGSGNFSFGEAGPAGSPAIGSGWEVVEVKNITVDTTSVTFSGLNGDVDGEYMMLFRIRNVAPTGPSQQYSVRPNGISTSQNTTTAFHSGTGANGITTSSDMRIFDAGSFGSKQAVGTFNFDAKTGTEARQLIADISIWSNALTNNARDTISCVWTDTTTNITSLDIVASQGLGIAAGSQFCLYKKTSVALGDPALELIETIDVVAPATTVSFTGLNGDVDKLYSLIWTIRKTGGPASPITKYVLRPNGVTTNQQSVCRTNSSSGANISTITFDLQLAESGGVTNDGQMTGETLIHAETGQIVRSFKTEALQTFPSFASPPSLNNLSHSGFWNESVTNITSLDIVAVGGIHPIGAGSTFSLYRVNK
jgi:hypothetical protein